jgi:hypothetical protein
MKWRRASVLELYNLSFGLFLLISPWLFAYASEGARIDLRMSGAVIAAMSIAAAVAFLGTGFCPYPGDAHQHRPRHDGRLHRGTRIVAGKLRAPL